MVIELSRMLLLIVEEDQEIRNLIRWALQDAKPKEIKICKSGKDALEALAKFPADIALVQLDMTAMTGIEFTRRVRAGEAGLNPDMPVVLTIGAVDEATIREACSAGVQNFLRKPFTAAALVKRMRGTLRNPRRFVSAENYLGPDRRIKDEAGKIPDPERRGSEKNDPAPAAPPAKPKAAKAKAAAPPAKAPVPAHSAEDWEAEMAAAPEPEAGGQRSSDDWRDALGPEEGEEDEVPAAEELNLETALEEHKAWSESGGKEGKIANLNGADLVGANLSGAILAGVRMREADLSDADLSGANLRNADLRGADLSAANLKDADLGQAKLRHARLKFANLAGANLRGTDLAGCNLEGANLAGADLKDAIFLGADLSSADLRGDGLVQDQLRQSLGNVATKLPPGLAITPPE